MLDLSNVVFIHPENAALGAAEPPPVASAPPAADPTFAAIERLRAAEARHTAADIASDQARAGRDAPAMAEADALRVRAAAELRAEEDSFLSTVPLTLAGLRAGLAYAFEFDADGYQLRPFVESILRSPAWTPEAANSLLEAIERHKALVAEIDALPEYDDDNLERLSELERAALCQIAMLPCRDDGAFLMKLRYLLAAHKLDCEPSWREEAPEIIAALELHLSGEITA